MISIYSLARRKEHKNSPIPIEVYAASYHLRTQIIDHFCTHCYYFYNLRRLDTQNGKEPNPRVQEFLSVLLCQEFC